MSEPFKSGCACVSTQAHPIDPAVRQEILRKLQAVEAEHDVRVLYACESGSRGWGFASPDSDYDVRFVFVRPAKEYLRVTPMRDVIEEVPGPVFDVNGWDVLAKKYLYVLRPLLAAKWVLERPEAPPMAFESLMRELVGDPAVRQDIEELLALKRRSGEKEWLPARPLLNRYLSGLLAELAEASPGDGMPDTTLPDELLAETVLAGRA